MKKLMLTVLFALVLAIAGKVSLCAAQDAAANNEDKFSFGKVVSVSAQQISVKEYDFAKDADIEVAYTVTPETELGNITAVTELVANDDVVIDYVEKEGKRVVTTLVKEEKTAENTSDTTAAVAPAATAPVATAPVVTAPAATEPAAVAPVATEPVAPAPAVMVPAPAEQAPVSTTPVPAETK